jgi:hypothetical protein
MENSNTEETKITPAKINNHEFTTIYSAEIQSLKSLAQKIFLTLGVIIVISGILLGVRDSVSINLIWSCIKQGY